MPDYYAAAICPRGHVYGDSFNLDGVKQIRVGCEECGLVVLTGCEVCEYRIRGDAVPVALGVWSEYKRPEFCDNPDCRVPHPWASRQASIWALENLLEDEGLPEDERRAIARELKGLESDGLDEKDELARWQRVKAAAPRLWEEGKPIIFSLATEMMKKHLGL